MPVGLNSVIAVSAGALGIRLDPYLSFNFVVEVEGLLVGGFREVHGLESNVEVKEYAEGGLNRYLHKIPGETRYPNLVLSRGLTDIDTLWTWYEDVTQGNIVRRNLSLMLLDSQRLPVMWWDVKNAAPVKWTGPTFDASRSTDVAVESVELVHQGIVKPAMNRALAAARATAQVGSQILGG
jgi:phage tail-like protein